nr:uncharacterized protein LOC111429150 [Onthophagus taurus]
MNFLCVIITIYANILFTLVLTNPCLNLRKDKNDGLKIFTSSSGIRSEGDISLLARRKRSINNGGFVKIDDNQLYSDDNDLISSLKRKVYLPVYYFRTKRFAFKSRTTRSAVIECPWQEGSSSTGTDFYPKKPSDKQSVDILIGDNSENKKIEEENITQDYYNLREVDKEDEIKKENL